MKTRQIHFVCFFLLLAALGTGESAPFTARLLLDAARFSDTLPGDCSVAGAVCTAQQGASAPAHTAGLTLPVMPWVLRAAWPVRPPSAHSSAIQALTATPFAARNA